ncbi:MAG: TSUP family transporter, partial [Promethearchaeia archaeon]
IELFLGIFIIVYVISKFIEYKKNNALPGEAIQEASLKDIYIYSGGFMYGFLGGLIGASGPINVITLEKTGHHKESFVANFALVSVILSLFKLSIFIWNDLFPLELFLLFLLGLGVIAVVTRIGHLIAPKIPKQTFEIAILSLLLIMGCRFLVLNSFSLFF